MRVPYKLLTLVAIAPILGVAAAPRTISLYDVQRTDSPPTIDGKLDDACWKNRPVITNMVLRGESTRVPAQVQTKTTLLYDDKALYIAIEFLEPNPQGLKKSIVRYDGDLWWDDSVELYIEPGSSHQEYFKLMSNPVATRADWRGKNTPMGFKMFDWGTGAEWTVGAAIGERNWTLEFRVPWSDLEVNPPKAGDVWTFEIVRFRYADSVDLPAGESKHEYSSWNVGATHDKPENFGCIVFSGNTSEMERIMAEKLKPVFGGAIRVYGRDGEIRYTDYATLHQQRVSAGRELFKTLRTKLENVSPNLEQKTRETIQSQVADREKKLDALAAKDPSAATAEALDKLLEESGSVLWTLRYHELNASLSEPRP
ncbi:MAG TPA: sugar-binding protein [Planctomycetota bacterium]|jgi:hypothetical protein